MTSTAPCPRSARRLSASPGPGERRHPTTVPGGPTLLDSLSDTIIRPHASGIVLREIKHHLYPTIDEAIGRHDVGGHQERPRLPSCSARSGHCRSPTRTSIWMSRIKLRLGRRKAPRSAYVAAGINLHDCKEDLESRSETPRTSAEPGPGGATLNILQGACSALAPLRNRTPERTDQRNAPRSS